MKAQRSTKPRLRIRVLTTAAVRLLWMSWLLVTIPAPAQDFQIPWFTIDGGGGTSTGEDYAISGTIGQPDAGQVSGGNYTLAGGFWSFITDRPGASFLRILRTATNSVLVAWPTAATGFVLQHNSALGVSNWSDVTNSFTVVGNENQLIVSPPLGNEFYRLKSAP